MIVQMERSSYNLTDVISVIATPIIDAYGCKCMVVGTGKMNGYLVGPCVPVFWRGWLRGNITLQPGRNPVEEILW